MSGLAFIKMLNFEKKQKQGDMAVSLFHKKSFQQKTRDKGYMAVLFSSM